MWKKVLWGYLWLYILGVVLLIVYNSIIDIRNGDFLPVTLILPLFLLIPAGIIILELRGKKVPIIITIIGLLIIAVPVVGIFNFNDLNFATIGKAVIFVPLLAGLIYFGYKRIFGKRAKA
jgi:hypothetical protein